jgi:hypothetical protein
MHENRVCDDITEAQGYFLMAVFGGAILGLVQR